METNINTNVGTSLETTHTLDFSDKLYKILIGIIAVSAIFLVGELMYQFRSLPQNIPHEIMVSGEGKLYIKPDIAKVSFGVTSQSLKSQDAVNQNNIKMNAVIKAIKELGISDQDIQTTLYNLYPIYSYVKGDNVALGRPVNQISPSPDYYPYPGTQVITGYSLEQQISVKIKNFDNINSILDRATSAGATSVGQLQFAVDNPEKAQSQARAIAITKAKEKLQLIIGESGLRVGKLVNISEGYNNYPMPMYASAMSKDSASTTPEIQVGQQEVNSSVTLTYQVK